MNIWIVPFFFVKYLSILFVSIFLSKIWKSHELKFRGKLVQNCKSYICTDDFLFSTPKQPTNIRIGFEFRKKKKSYYKNSNQLRAKKKKKNIPSKAKNIAPSLAHKKKDTTKRFHKWKESYKIEKITHNEYQKILWSYYF